MQSLVGLVRAGLIVLVVVYALGGVAYALGWLQHDVAIDMGIKAGVLGGILLGAALALGSLGKPAKKDERQVP